MFAFNRSVHIGGIIISWSDFANLLYSRDTISLLNSEDPAVVEMYAGEAGYAQLRLERVDSKHFIISFAPSVRGRLQYDMSFADIIAMIFKFHECQFLSTLSSSMQSDGQAFLLNLEELITAIMFAPRDLAKTAHNTLVCKGLKTFKYLALLACRTGGENNLSTDFQLHYMDEVDVTSLWRFTAYRCLISKVVIKMHGGRKLLVRGGLFPKGGKGCAKCRVSGMQILRNYYMFVERYSAEVAQLASMDQLPSHHDHHRQKRRRHALGGAARRAAV